MSKPAPIGPWGKATAGATGAVLAAGVYATAVFDVVVGRLVARAPVRVGDALASPARDAALLALQRRTETERPDAALWAFAPALLGGLAAAALGTETAGSVSYFY